MSCLTICMIGVIARNQPEIFDLTTELKNRAIQRLAALTTPSAGMLGALCEENYRLFKQLIPAISLLKGGYGLESGGAPPLLVEIEKKGPWTQDLRMTHRFGGEGGKTHSDPDAILRIYHDAHLVEVSQFEKQRILPLEGLYEVPGLSQKWKANLFLGRWLRYCVSQRYQLVNIDGGRDNSPKIFTDSPV